MSRLGDLIRTERIRQNMTPKQVARKCGVSESYIIAVENGTRIIADDQARRILKSIGLKHQTEADFSLDDIAATVDLAQASPSLSGAVKKPAPAPAPRPQAEKVASTEPDKESEGVTGSIWLDALTSVLKNVPVMNAVLQPVDHRLLPIIQGRIEGGAPDKVFYFLAPDDSMRGFRIHSGDLALIVPAQSPIDGAIMLVEYNNHRFLRKIKTLSPTSYLLQSYDREYDAVTVQLREFTCIGRVARVEFTL
ncbi:MAG: LexA family transcriptional regulator [Clostridia bacterium]|nr:LexA family transcriptional regulator [Clostridia bacterium]